ncbi:MAG: DUF5804 family protein [Halorhabdus sp.]
MTRVCLLGDDDLALRQTLLSHETAREALQTYTLQEPFHNAVCVETVSLGAAVALLNDLQWYLVRYVETALIQEPSVSATEWLSRDLATAIRDDEVNPADSGQYLKVYGKIPPADAVASDDAPGGVITAPKLIEPMYVTRTEGSLPEYDLRDVEETVVLRVSEDEFSR